MEKINWDSDRFVKDMATVGIMTILTLAATGLFMIIYLASGGTL